MKIKVTLRDGTEIIYTFVEQIDYRNIPGSGSYIYILGEDRSTDYVKGTEYSLDDIVSIHFL